jgi:hypothetical protein
MNHLAQLRAIAFVLVHKPEFLLCGAALGDTHRAPRLSFLDLTVSPLRRRFQWWRSPR